MTNEEKQKQLKRQTQRAIRHAKVKQAQYRKRKVPMTARQKRLRKRKQQRCILLCVTAALFCLILFGFISLIRFAVSFFSP